jgi:FkbM family methyltransferase
MVSPGVGIPIDWRSYVREARQANSNFTIALEVGSYDGTDAYAAATETGNDVHVFEPSPTNFARCLKNYPPASNQRLHFHQVAASSARGTVEFWDDGGSGAGIGRPSTASAKGATTQVPAERLDSAPQLLGIRRYIGVVKIDVQGHELAVLNGMSQWLRHQQRPKRLIFELDPCLMNEAAGTGVAPHNRANVSSAAVALLEQLHTAGYSLQIGNPYDGEVWYWAFASLALSGRLDNAPCTTHKDCAELVKQSAEANHLWNLAFDASKILGGKLSHKDAHKVRTELNRMASYLLQPRSCEEVADFFCPSGATSVGRDLKLKAMYTDLVATSEHVPPARAAHVRGWARDA